MKLRRLVSLNGKLRQEIVTINTGTVSDGDKGDITVSSSGTEWTIDANAVSLSKIAQLAALSVLGNPTNAMADMSAITAGSDYQVLRRSGTSVGFGAIDISQSAAVTGVLNVANGGTGNNTYAIGDMLYASGATTLSKLADVSAGSYLRSGGVTTAPLWSTLILPNTATQYYIPHATAPNTIGESGNLQFNGTNFSIGGTADSHRMKITAGTITNQKSALYISATMPTVITATTNAVHYSITSAGSSSFTNRALEVDYLAGYTGSSNTNAGAFVNSSEGTGSLLGLITVSGNIGNSGAATGATTGANVGLMGFGNSGNKSVGVFGRGSNTNSGKSSIGVLGLSIASGGGGAYQIGGYFGTQSTEPTFASAALMCDNGSDANDIFVARDNGTAKWTIADGGHTTWGDAVNMVFNTSTGTKIGTGTSQKIGIWNTTPIVQPTTAIAAATFTANTSAIANDTATFDGYTIGQVVKALRNFGILA